MDNATSTDIEIQKFLTTRVSAALRNVGDNAYLAHRVNGIANLYHLPWRTDSEQIKRVLAGMSDADMAKSLTGAQ